MFPPPLLGKGCGGVSHSSIKPAAFQGVGGTAVGMKQVRWMEGRVGMAAQTPCHLVPLPCPETGLSPAFGDGRGLELTLLW